MLKDTRLEGEIESVRFLAPQVAVAHWTGSVAYLMAAAGATPPAIPTDAGGRAARRALAGHGDAYNERASPYRIWGRR